MQQVMALQQDVALLHLRTNCAPGPLQEVSSWVWSGTCRLPNAPARPPAARDRRQAVLVVSLELVRCAIVFLLCFHCFLRWLGICSCLLRGCDRESGAVPAGTVTSQNRSGGGNCVGECGETGPTQAVCSRRPPTDKLCQICHTSSVRSHLTARLWR